METFHIYNNLSWLNELPEEQALFHLHSCSGSEIWARRMVGARPFPMLRGLYEAADTIWFALPQSERISAFSTLVHEAKAARDDKTDLEQAASLYREKFGFIFVLCESGNTAEEVLATCKARLGNSVETELQIASEECWKIIELRLNKLLEQ